MQPPQAIELQSLRHAQGLLREQARRQVLLPVDDAWFQSVHETHDVAPATGVTIVQEMVRLSQSPAVLPAKSLIQRVADVVPGSRPGEFMAPMCCPLTKVDLAGVSDPSNGYLVTEKSDGLRALIVSIAERQYPRWQVLLPAGAVDAAKVIGLYDQAMLEGAFQELVGDAAEFKAGVQLSLGVGKLYAPESGPEGSDICKLQLLANGASDIEDLTVRRVKDVRHFTYIFDRSMSAVYLMLDEFPFPSGITRIVLDGELLLSYRPAAPGAAQPPPPRLLFAVFDLLSYHAFDDATSRSVEANREYVCDASMSERLEMLNDVVMGPMKERSTADAIPVPQAVAVFVKKMVAVKDLLSLVQDIAVFRRPQTDATQPVSADGDAQYFYMRTGSFNDGLIFTPDKFDVAAGSCPTQFKWKWPGKLSVDFLVCAPLVVDADSHQNQQGNQRRRGPPPPPPPAPVPVPDGMLRVVASLLFKQRGTRGQSDRSGHVRVGPMLMFNPNKIKLPAPDESPREIVVECSLAVHPETGEVAWRVDKVRKDKHEANAMITAFSVLESIAEHTTLERLCGTVGVTLDDALKARFRGAPVPEAAWAKLATMDVPPRPRMMVRARSVRGRAYPSIQWQVRLPDMKKSSLACNHRPVEQCIGLGHDTPPVVTSADDPLSSKLVGDVMLALANGGGCVGWSDTTVKAAFDPQSGRWVMGDVSLKAADKDMAWCTDVFRHLNGLAMRVVASGGSPGPDDFVTTAIQPDAAATTEVVTGANDVPSSVQPLAPTDGHYAQRTRELARGTGRSALRLHNNWVKAIIFAVAASHAQQSLAASSSAADRQALTLLDLCCGRGGDLHKIARLPAKQALLIDSCYEAVVEAAGRYSIGSGLSTCSVHTPGVPMAFRVSDCFNSDATLPIIQEVMGQPGTLTASRGGFDLVSCQFSMHYAFNDERSVRGFLKTVAGSLRSGGVFLATTVDDEALLAWRQRCGDDFGNADFHVHFVPEDASLSTYGAPYRISVQSSVDDAMEYVVEWRKFLDVAKEYGLELIETKNFDEITEHSAAGGGAAGGMVEALASAGDVPSANDPSPGDDANTAAAAQRPAVVANQKRPRTAFSKADMTHDEREAAGLFRTLLMRKV